MDLGREGAIPLLVLEANSKILTVMELPMAQIISPIATGSLAALHCQL